MNYVCKLRVLHEGGEGGGRDGAGGGPQEVVHQGGQVASDITSRLAGSIWSKIIFRVIFSFIFSRNIVFRRKKGISAKSF